METAQISGVAVLVGLCVALACLYLARQVVHLWRVLMALHTFLATVWVEYRLRYHDSDNHG